MVELGKLKFRFATEDDESLAEQFCKSQNYSNNTSLKKMKWEWVLEEGAWTIATYEDKIVSIAGVHQFCLLYTSPSPRDGLLSRMPSSA